MTFPGLVNEPAKLKLCQFSTLCNGESRGKVHCITSLHLLFHHLFPHPYLARLSHSADMTILIKWGTPGHELTPKEVLCQVEMLSRWQEAAQEEQTPKC